MNCTPRLSLSERRLSIALQRSDQQSAINASTFAQAWSVTLDLPPHFVELLILIEDKRFCKHVGIDVFGMARAVRHNLKGGRCRQGASTLSQQLYGIRSEIKSGVTYRRTLRSKICQIAFGLWVTTKMSKSEILAEYVQTVYWGRRMYGLKAAAKYYFGKNPSTLKVEESFFLVERLASPNRMRRKRLEVIMGRVVIQELLERHGSSPEDIHNLYTRLGLVSTELVCTV